MSGVYYNRGEQRNGLQAMSLDKYAFLNLREIIFIPKHPSKIWLNCDLQILSFNTNKVPFRSNWWPKGEKGKKKKKGFDVRIL